MFKSLFFPFHPVPCILSDVSCIMSYVSCPLSDISYCLRYQVYSLVYTAYYLTYLVYCLVYPVYCPMYSSIVYISCLLSNVSSLLPNVSCLLSIYPVYCLLSLILIHFFLDDDCFIFLMKSRPGSILRPLPTVQDKFSCTSSVHSAQLLDVFISHASTTPRPA